ncbi:MAG TPA: BamA/TamA family outer membrane protein [Stellaceae bacterium]|nr:BamA/TamA family outer membrane protein [Stellaceae bacterium]
MGLLPADAGRADIRYRATISATGNSELTDLLDKVSDLKTLENHPPASETALRGRADRDLGRLADAAHSLGYWDAHFAYHIDTSSEPQQVTVKVTPGPLYHVASVEVLGPDGKRLALPPGAAPLPLKPGDAARTAPVVGAEAALLAVLGNGGYPFAKVSHRQVVIDHATHTMAVTYTVAPGARSRFGAVAITGLKKLDPGYVERRLGWQRGQLYDASKVEATRQTLIESGLFSTVLITPTPVAGEPGVARMTIAATERPNRTIGAGLGYNTSQGAAARVFWENRDLFGHAEYLRLGATGGQQVYGLNANFRRPDFLVTNQDFLATAEIANETPTAYHSRRALVTTGFERRFGRWLTIGAALEAEKANVVQLANVSSNTSAQRTQRYTLIGIPAYIKFDTTDNLLSPTRGWRAQLSVTPAHILSSPSETFVTNYLSASSYWQVGAQGRTVLAGRVALASLDGAPLGGVPADQRIYAGGGGSIRAYGYQMAGPLASNNDPIGGKSSLVVNFETRVRVTDTIGLVPFIDAGSYYESSVPQLNHRLFYGVGLGLRYYTSFGPLRLDLATPLYKRSADSWVQVYISLGEAF